MKKQIWVKRCKCGRMIREHNKTMLCRNCFIKASIEEKRGRYKYFEIGEKYSKVYKPVVIDIVEGVSNGIRR